MEVNDRRFCISYSSFAYFMLSYASVGSMGIAIYRVMYIKVREIFNSVSCMPWILETMVILWHKLTIVVLNRWNKPRYRLYLKIQMCMHEYICILILSNCIMHDTKCINAFILNLVILCSSWSSNTMRISSTCLGNKLGDWYNRGQEPPMHHLFWWPWTNCRPLPPVRSRNHNWKFNLQQLHRTHTHKFEVVWFKATSFTNPT